MSDRSAVDGIDRIPIVGAKFELDENVWTIELSTSLTGRSTSRRQKLAIERICELDYAVKLSLEQGKTVRLIVNLTQSTVDGPHSATEQVLPLLMPLNIQDNLYSYQREGVAWLLRHQRALLGDDMGLGKTAQAVSAARRLIRFGKVAWVLVVCPRTLIANWLSELNSWAPELTFATAMPLSDTRELSWQRIVRRAHFVVSSYEQLRNPPLSLLENPPELVIADEAHRLRNIDSQSTAGFRRLKTDRLWALTGTPLEREAEDLAVIMSLIVPSKFSIDAKNLPIPTLRARSRPYILRRRKQQVLSELPPVIEEKETLELSGTQKRAYQSAIEAHVKQGRQRNFLALFNQLRMICDLESHTGSSSKLDRVVELLSEIQRSREKAVVFSYILLPLYKLKERLESQMNSMGFTLITGEMTLEQREMEIQKFKSEIGCTAILASTRIASEGLTLTEANHVIFVNQWWNPSSNAQAKDRVVRIGQTKPVNVWTFTCKGTVEERLQILLAEKSRTFSELIDQLARTSKGGEDLDLSR